jgi:hypothetical protein
LDWNTVGSVIQGLGTAGVCAVACYFLWSALQAERAKLDKLYQSLVDKLKIGPGGGDEPKDKA